MSEDKSGGDTTDEEGPDVTAEDVQEGIAKGRERLQEEADKAVEGFDEGLVDLLSWVLDTETKARIYVYLRQNSGSTSQEIADGTGLYPSTVREALAELAEEGTVTREKRESEGAGNNPYEYQAIAPSDLVGSVVTDVQSELNTVFNLDDYLGGAEVDPDSEPVTITVEDASADGGGPEGDDAAAPDGGPEGGDDEPDGAASDGDGAGGDDAPDGDA